MQAQEDKVVAAIDGAQAKLIIKLAQTTLALTHRVAALEAQVAKQAREIEDFRSLADVFARFIGEAKS
jgi:hypothetical protein